MFVIYTSPMPSQRSSFQLNARSRSKKDIAMDFLKSVGKTMDSSFTNFKDTDPFFEMQKFFVVHYNAAFVYSKLSDSQIMMSQQD